MKKLLLGISLSFLLVACGTGESEDVSTEQPTNDEAKTEEVTDENMSQSEWMEENHPEQMDEYESNISDDPLEVADKSNEVDTLLDGFNEHKILYRFENEDTDENGLNTLEFGDYEVKFAVALTEDINGNQEISIFGEKENNGEENLTNPADTEIVTDQQEKTSLAYDDLGIMEAGLKEKFFAPTTELDYENPESLTITTYEPVPEEELDAYMMDEKTPNEIVLELEKTE